MSRKDYKAIAEAIKSNDTKVAIAEAIAYYCKNDNPAFSKGKFMEACNL